MGLVVRRVGPHAGDDTGVRSAAVAEWRGVGRDVMAGSVYRVTAGNLSIMKLWTRLASSFRNRTVPPPPWRPSATLAAADTLELPFHRWRLQDCGVRPGEREPDRGAEEVEGLRGKLSRAAGLPVPSQRRCLPVSAGQSQCAVSTRLELAHLLATGRR
jgi:hypothetical protein